MRRLLSVVVLLLMAVNNSAQVGSRSSLPAGYWPAEKSGPIIEKMATTRLAPDLSRLTPGERAAVDKLLEVGAIFQTLYERQRHAQAEEARARLARFERSAGSAAGNLATLYRLFQGPIATTLENRREPFLPVDPPQPGKNVYPWGVKREEVESFLSAHPERREEILDTRTVVRRASVQNARADLAVLRRHPVLDGLHPSLRRELQRVVARPDARGFYAVPYAVAYADEMVRAHALLNEAADAVRADDAEFAGYLRNRARDLLTNDYESGDAAWVTGRFKNLNAQIGAYETYDDELYGVKAFFSLSLLAARREEGEALRRAMSGLQALEESLPYDRHKRVREDIPVGVYDVIADFGQSRGGNTATILPNEALYARRYGRTILLRANIMRDPEIFSGTDRAWEAAVAPAHKDELTSDGTFYRTLWHEVGHYLGVDLTRDGRELGTALQENADLLEEMKADLVSLFVAGALRRQNYYTDAQLRSLYASGINRVLQNNRPRRDQPYQTMQLMQWNYFLEQGVLSFDARTQKLSINYGRYHDAVGKLLAEVLKIQSNGDRAEADRFIERYTKWDEALHGAVAKSIRDQQRYRFRLFRYAALGE
jgi:hypothetical protein